MNELEGMINGLLSNPEEMKKIMEIANSVMENSPGEGGSGGEGSAGVPSPQIPPGLGSLLGNLGSLGSIAPILGNAAKSLIGAGGASPQTVGGGLGDKGALFEAMRPFLSERRQGKLDKAAQMAKVMSMGLALFGKKGGRA